MKNDSNNKKPKQEYSLIPYLITFFLAAVILILISYFSTIRHHTELNKFSAPDSAAYVYRAGL